MKIHVISFTNEGCAINTKICKEFLLLGENCQGFAMERYACRYHLLPLQDTISLWTKEAFKECDAIIFIGACGIAVRAIAPYIKDKFTDPAVISMDELGRYIIPLLSGHVGGANVLAKRIAFITKGVPVISTATDINGVFAVDVFAKENQLIIKDRELAKQISVDLLDGKAVGFESELQVEGSLPTGLINLGDIDRIQTYIDDKMNKNMHNSPMKNINRKIQISIAADKNNSVSSLQLIPQIICLGIGCKKGTKIEDLEEFILDELQKHKLMLESVLLVASIDLKKEEEALCLLANKYRWKFLTYSSEQLNSVEGDFCESEFVREVTGVGNVCERAAILSSDYGELLEKKTKKQGMTLAIAKKKRRIFFE